MRRRAIAASFLSASAVLVITWLLGVQAHSGTPPILAGAVSPSAGSIGRTGGTSSDTTTSPPAANSGSSGTYTGAVESTHFGDVQVSITVTDGTISDVTPLHLTDSDGRSVQISNRAAPVLRQEVLSAQSASVQMVSGATYTSEAYLASLQSAIDQAGL